MGDNDLMEKILLQMQDDLQSIKVGQVEMRTEIGTIKSEMDELKCDDEGRDLLGVIRVLQNYPKVSAGLFLVTLVGLVMTSSVFLSTYKIDKIVERAAGPYLTGPPAPYTVITPKEYDAK
jgi:hypothetical protein